MKKPPHYCECDLCDDYWAEVEDVGEDMSCNACYPLPPGDPNSCGVPETLGITCYAKGE